MRLADGRVFTGELAPWRHRALQLGLLHGDSDGFVELTPGVRAPDGRLDLDRRRRAEHYLPRGASGREEWIARLLEHAEQIAHGAFATRRFDGHLREEAFVGVAPRMRRRGNKEAVALTRFLWVDVDRPGQLPALWAFLAQRPCHLLIASGGSGGVHAYWQLDQPLLAGPPTEPTGPIERANLRIIHRLGVDPEGRPNVADVKCRERARVMRVAGSINYKTGRHARVLEADLHLAAYPIEELVGDLPDPQAPSARSSANAARRVDDADPYKRIAPPQYFARLAGIDVPARGGLVRCPAHDDAHPSCSVGAEASLGWCCHACDARGAIYDLASVLIGGPVGPALRGEAFKRARAYVADVLGELT